jgi:hypothetical protein
MPKIGSLVKWINGYGGEEYIGFIDSVDTMSGSTDYVVTWLTPRENVNSVRPYYLNHFTLNKTWFLVEG